MDGCVGKMKVRGTCGSFNIHDWTQDSIQSQFCHFRHPLFILNILYTYLYFFGTLWFFSINQSSWLHEKPWTLYIRLVKVTDIVTLQLAMTHLHDLQIY